MPISFSLPRLHWLACALQLICKALRVISCIELLILQPFCHSCFRESSSVPPPLLFLALFAISCPYWKQLACVLLGFRDNFSWFLVEIAIVPVLTQSFVISSLIVTDRVASKFLMKSSSWDIYYLVETFSLIFLDTILLKLLQSWH